jgi:hypothetical protein
MVREINRRLRYKKWYIISPWENKLSWRYKNDWESVIYIWLVYIYRENFIWEFFAINLTKFKCKFGKIR